MNESNRDHFRNLKKYGYEFLPRTQIPKFFLWTNQNESTDNEALQTIYFAFGLPFWQNRDQFGKI